MNATLQQKLFFGVMAMGLLARLIAWHWGPPIYPDAVFQYLEPAWGQISGVGLQSHEWREGFYSWALPGYNGAWMALFARLGLRGSIIGELMKLHWLSLSMLMVWAAWRGGASVARQMNRPGPGSLGADGVIPGSGWQGGLLAALLIAVFPLLCLFSIEPISELPSMIALTCVFCFTAELVEQGERASQTRAAIVGFVLSFSVCIRSVNAPVALIAPYWIFLCGSRRLLIPMALGALPPIAVFGILDRITWGGFFFSYFKHLTYNVVDGHAVDYGAEPAGWYLRKLLSRAPIGVFLLFGAAILGGRATLPFLAAAGGYLILISTQGHKEERFMFIVWPMLLTGAGAAAGGWLMRAYWMAQSEKHRGRSFKRLLLMAQPIVVGLCTLLLVWESSKRLGDHEYGLTRARYSGALWVGHQPDTTGLLVDWPPYTGAYLWFDNTVPFMKFEKPLLENRIFSHAMLIKGTDEVREAVAAGFEPLFERDSIVILKRKRATRRN